MTVESLLTTILGVATSPAVILALVFIAVALGVGSCAYWLMGTSSPVDRRLKEVTGDYFPDRHMDYRQGNFNVHWVEPVAKLVQPSAEWKRSRFKTQLVRAGYRHPAALSIFFSAKAFMAVLVPVVMLLPLLLLDNSQIEGTPLMIGVGMLALIGFMLPDIYLYQHIQRRKQILSETFPDAMDLLVVCVESGLGLDGAIQKVGKELEYSAPELAEELSLVNLELRAGKVRQEALESLADRTGLTEIQSLVSILVQAEHFGTSVAESLREQANEMRRERIQRAKEKAAKLPVRMVFPIVLFIFPALFLVILGPAAVNIYNALIVTQ